MSNMKIFYNRHGSLTIFMSLILTVVMIFTTILIDGGRIILARNIVSGAGDMALNAGLTYYNSVLQDTYGIFAISANMDDLRKNLEVYFDATLNSNGLNDQGLVKELVDIALSGSSGSEISDIMKMKLADDGFEISQAAGANLSNANVLRAQVLDYMKYRAPAVIGYGFLEKMNILKSLPDQQKALEAKRDYEKKLKDIQDLCLEIYALSRDYEDYLINTNGNFKTPFEIKEGVYRWGNNNFQYATRDAIAYVQVEKLPKLREDKYWKHNSHNPLGGELKDSVAGFDSEISGLKDDFYSVTSSLSYESTIGTLRGDASLEYNRFDKYVRYYHEYEDNVYKFHTVNARYDYSFKLYNERIVKINEDLASLKNNDGGENDNSNKKQELEAEKQELEDEWKRVKKWYDESFIGDWGENGVNEIIPEHYGSTEISNVPFGPNYNINNLRDKYMQDLKKDIELLAIPQMRNARDYYVWFAELKSKASDVREKLLELKEASEVLQKIADRWDINIGNMAESGVKNDMRQDYNVKTKAVIEGYVDEMTKIFDNSIDYSTKVMTDLEKFKYAGITPATSLDSDKQWVENIISYVSVLTNTDTLDTNSQIESKQNALNNLGIYENTESSSLSFFDFEKNIPGKIPKVVEMDGGYKVVDSEFEYKDPKLRNFLGVECYDIDATYDWSAYNDGKYYVDPLFAFFERNSVATKPDGDSEEKSKRDKMINGSNVYNTPEPVQINNTNIANVMNISAKAAQIMDENTLESLQNGEADELVDRTLNTSNEAISGFDRIEDILVGGRDKLYLMAYTTTMFSCYTTNREVGGNTNEKTLSGIPFSEKNNAAYRAEQEYILLGNPNLRENVNGVYNRILGIRILLNAIYAYTSDSALRNETFVMATAIAGWTGFGIPIVQNVLLLAAALTESVLDTNDLLAGKTVPLYKNPNVWRSRFSGMVEFVAETAAGELYKKMNEYTDETKESFNDTLDIYVTDMVDTSTNTIITSIQTPIQEKIVWCLAQVGDARDGLEERLRTSIKESFDQMQADIEAEVTNGGLVARAKLEAFKAINTTENQNKLASYVMESVGITKENINEVTEKVNNNIEKFFDNKKEDLKQRINSVIDKNQLKEKLKTSIGSAIDAANSNAQEVINNKINEFNKEFEGAGGDALTIGEGRDKLELNGFDKTKASTFNMSYRDYLMVFLAIQYLIDEQGVICRMGNLIQTNASKEGSLYYAGKEFSMQEATVLLQVEAKAEIKPIFINLETINNNNAIFKLEDAFGYPINYKGVLGY